MKDREEKLKAQIEKAEKELDSIREANKLGRNKKLVGKYLKAQKCYSFNDLWWFYFAVTDISDEGDLVGWSFEVNHYGKTTLNPYDIIHYSDGLVEISINEFGEALNEFIERIPRIQKGKEND